MLIKPRLALECRLCDWRRGASRDIVNLPKVAEHFETEHPGEQMALEPAAVCSCGSLMKLTNIRPTGGGYKHHFDCPACGNQGWLKSTTGAANYKQPDGGWIAVDRPVG